MIAFQKCLVSTSKLGRTLLQVSDEGVSLSSVDASQTHFCRFEFPSSFFLDFIPESSVQLLPNFNLSLTDALQLIIDVKDDFILINTTCKHNIQKTTKLYLQDADALFPIYHLSSRVVIDAKTIRNMLIHFNSVDISLSISQYSFIISSHSKQDCLATKIDLDIQEFSSYKCQQDATLVVNCKDFKNSLLGDQVALLFEKAGDPLVLEYSCEEYNCKFVLATVADDEIQTDNTNIPASPPRNSGISMLQELSSTPKLKRTRYQ